MTFASRCTLGIVSLIQMKSNGTRPVLVTLVGFELVFSSQVIGTTEVRNMQTLHVNFTEVHSVRHLFVTDSLQQKLFVK